MASQRINPLCITNSIQDGTCFENYDVFFAKETTARLSFRASDTSSSSELEHPNTASGAMERSARDFVPMDLELHRNLVRSLTRSTSEGSSRHPSLPRPRTLFLTHPYRSGHQANADSNQQTENFPKCSLLETRS